MGGELGCCFLFYSLRFSVSEILSFNKSIWQKSLERGKGFPPRPRSPPWMPRGVSLGNHPLLICTFALARLPNSREGSEDIHQARFSCFQSFAPDQFLTLCFKSNFGSKCWGSFLPDSNIVGLRQQDNSVRQCQEACFGAPLRSH